MVDRPVSRLVLLPTGSHCDAQQCEAYVDVKDDPCDPEHDTVVLDMEDVWVKMSHRARSALRDSQG